MPKASPKASSKASSATDARRLSPQSTPRERASVNTPERVRFATPAILSFDGYEERFEVSVINLSAQGGGLPWPRGPRHWRSRCGSNSACT